MLKLKLQHFAHLMQRGDSLEKILMLGNRKQKEKRVAEDEMVSDCFNWIELCVVVRMFVSHKNSYVEILMPFHGIRKCGAFGG